MELMFEVYPGSKSEKKNSRRYGAVDEKSPITDIYVKRPFSEGKDKLIITIKES